jgi:hypothetical protein
MRKIQQSGEIETTQDEGGTAMSVQQTTGMVLLFVGLAALSVSVGVAWILSRLARDGRVDGTWFVGVISLLLFLTGIALCWFGVSAIVEG